MDVLVKYEDLPLGEWIDVSQKLPDVENGVFKVKFLNNEECIAYFCADRCYRMMKYYTDPYSYWWHNRTHGPLYDVTHWWEPLFTIKGLKNARSC